jgi:DNA repair photolyase
METTTEEKGRGTMNRKPVFNVAAKSIINTKSGFAKKLLCDGMTFSAGDACVYGCAFCYVPSMYQKLERVADLKRAHGLNHEEMVVRRDRVIEILNRELVHPGGKLKYPDQNDTRVIYASPSVDVAGNMELVRETVEICKLILTYTAWQIRLLSKSNLIHKIAELLQGWEDSGIYVNARERVIYGVSTGTLDDEIARAFEQGTPLVSSRIKSLHWLQERGYRTFGMVCPSLPLVNAQEYMKFSHSIMDAIRVEKCEHVWAEVINVRGDSMTRTVGALRSAGFEQHAALLEHVSTDQTAWNSYNAATFHAHATELAARGQQGKLRFLTYVTKDTKPYWEECRAAGAVLL